MPVVGTGLGQDVDVGAGIAPEGGVVLAGLYLEFLNRVGIGNSHAAREVPRACRVVNFHPVHLKIVIAIVASTGHHWSVYPAAANLTGIERLSGNPGR